MALFKSQIVSEARGSVNGTTFSRNRYGAYMRSRAKPVNPGTALQSVIRNAFTAISAAWRALTSAQRANWVAYAATVPKTNKVGDSINLTGNAIFVACNTPRVAFMGATNVVSAAPTNSGVVPLETPVVTFNTGTSIAVAPIASDAWTTTAGSRLLIFASGMKTASIGFFKGPYKFIGSMTGSASTSFALPSTISTGNQVFLAFRVVGADGRISDQIRSSATF